MLYVAEPSSTSSILRNHAVPLSCCNMLQTSSTVGATHLDVNDSYSKQFLVRQRPVLFWQFWSFIFLRPLKKHPLAGVYNQAEYRQNHSTFGSFAPLPKALAMFNYVILIVTKLQCRLKKRVDSYQDFVPWHKDIASATNKTCSCMSSFSWTILVIFPLRISTPWHSREVLAMPMVHCL